MIHWVVMSQPSTLPTLDYSSLSKPVTTAELAQFDGVKTDAGLRQARRMKIGAYSTLTLVCAAGIVLIVTASNSTHALAPIGIWAFIISGLIMLTMVSSAHSRKQRIRMERFAALNNITYRQNIPSGNPAGMIYNHGHSRTVDQVLIFPSGFEIGNYHYTTGSGKNKSTHHWGYVHIELPRRLPHMVLDAKQNNFLSLVSNLPTGFSRSQVLSLEGDFDTYFTLYAPETYKTDALYVFTPDVMAALIDNGRDYDIEIVDNSLNLYTKKRFSLDSPETLDPLLTIIDIITKEIGRQGSRYRDENITTTTASNSIAIPGRRLRTSVSATAILAIVILSLYFILIIAF